MTYIVLDGALNSTHSLTLSHIRCPNHCTTKLRDTNSDDGDADIAADGRLSIRGSASSIRLSATTAAVRFGCEIRQSVRGRCRANAAGLCRQTRRKSTTSHWLNYFYYYCLK